MEENKKTNKGLIILVVILLLACIGMGGFIFLNKDKLFNETTIPETNNEEDIENIVTNNTSLTETLYGMTRSEYNKCEYALQPLLLEKVGDKLTVSNMEDEYKVLIAYNYLIKSKEIPEEQMKQAIEKVFGPSTYKVMNNIHIDGLGNIIYDANNKKYVSDFNPNEPWGCITHLYNKEKIIDTVEKDDTIQIITAYIFNGNFKTDLYKDAKENEPLGISMSINADENKTLAFIDEHKDELHQLTYTFKKASDENYYYISVERTK